MNFLMADPSRSLLSDPTAALSTAMPDLSAGSSPIGMGAGPAFNAGDMPDLTAALGGGGGVGMSFGAPPIPPEPMNVNALFPSHKTAALQSILPLIAAAIVGGSGGGMAGAEGLLHGAAAGNDAFNEQERQRAITVNQIQQQRYARDVGLYNQRWERAKDRSAMMADLTKQAMAFDDPDSARSWLASQRRVYAPFGIDPTEVLQGGKLPGEDEKVAKSATAAYGAAVDSIKKMNPDSAIDLSTLNNSYMVTFRGKRMKLGELAAIGGGPSLAPGQDSGITSTKSDANAILSDMTTSFRETAGREPDAEERAALRLKALQQYASATKKPDDALDLQIKRAQLNLLGLRSARLQAGAEGGVTLSQQQLQFGRLTAKDYEAASKPFNLRAQSYDTINSLMGGPHTPQSDTAMVFSYMKMLDPTSTVREGEQAQVRNARGVPDSVRNMWNQLMTGTTLTNRQRLDVANRARDMYYSLAKGQAQQFSVAADQLRTMGIEPSLFLRPQGSISDAAPYRQFSASKPATPAATPAPIAAGPLSSKSPTPALNTPTDAMPRHQTGSTVLYHGKPYTVVGYDAQGRVQLESK